MSQKINEIWFDKSTWCLLLSDTKKDLHISTFKYLQLMYSAHTSKLILVILTWYPFEYSHCRIFNNYPFFLPTTILQICVNHKSTKKVSVILYYYYEISALTLTHHFLTFSIDVTTRLISSLALFLVSALIDRDSILGTPACKKIIQCG